MEKNRIRTAYGGRVIKEPLNKNVKHSNSAVYISEDWIHGKMNHFAMGLGGGFTTFQI